MKRQEIRLSATLALAKNGYSQALYSWKGPLLQIFNREGKPIHELRFPSGISRKRFIETISKLPVVGPPKQVNNYAAGLKDDGYRQTDLVEMCKR